MKKKLREDAEAIYTYAIQEVLPDRSVKRALESFSKGTGRLSPSTATPKEGSTG